MPINNPSSSSVNPFAANPASNPFFNLINWMSALNAASLNDSNTFVLETSDLFQVYDNYNDVNKIHFEFNGEEHSDELNLINGGNVIYFNAGNFTVQGDTANFHDVIFYGGTHGNIHSDGAWYADSFHVGDGEGTLFQVGTDGNVYTSGGVAIVGNSLEMYGGAVANLGDTNVGGKLLYQIFNETPFGDRNNDGSWYVQNLHANGTIEGTDIVGNGASLTEVLAYYVRDAENTSHPTSVLFDGSNGWVLQATQSTCAEAVSDGFGYRSLQGLFDGTEGWVAVAQNAYSAVSADYAGAAVHATYLDNLLGTGSMIWDAGEFWNLIGNLQTSNNITAAAFFGDGANLTNLPSLNVDSQSIFWDGSEWVISNNLQINGSINASSFYGDGSNLTNLPTGGDVYLASSNIFTSFNTFDISAGGSFSVNDGSGRLYIDNTGTSDVLNLSDDAYSLSLNGGQFTTNGTVEGIDLSAGVVGRIDGSSWFFNWATGVGNFNALYSAGGSLLYNFNNAEDNSYWLDSNLNGIDLTHGYVGYYGGTSLDWAAGYLTATNVVCDFINGGTINNQSGHVVGLFALDKDCGNSGDTYNPFASDAPYIVSVDIVDIHEDARAEFTLDIDAWTSNAPIGGTFHYTTSADVVSFIVMAAGVGTLYGGSIPPALTTNQTFGLKKIGTDKFRIIP